MNLRPDKGAALQERAGVRIAGHIQNIIRPAQRIDDKHQGQALLCLSGVARVQRPDSAHFRFSKFPRGKFLWLLLHAAGSSIPLCAAVWAA